MKLDFSKTFYIEHFLGKAKKIALSLGQLQHLAHTTSRILQGM